MKHFGTQLVAALKEKNIKQANLARLMNVSPVTVNRWTSEASIDAIKLEKISNIVKKPITYWFECDFEVHEDLDVSSFNALLAEKDKEIQHMQDLLNEKERLIQLLMSKV